MATKLDKGLAWLSDVKNADNVRVLRKCSDEMLIMWRCYSTINHSLFTRRRVHYQLVSAAVVEKVMNLVGSVL